jgi:hypothetical protein
MDFMVCPKGVNAMKESRASPKRHQRVWTMIYNTGISPFVTGKSSSGYSLQPEPTAYSTQHPYATIQLGKTTITPRVLFQVLATGEELNKKLIRHPGGICWQGDSTNSCLLLGIYRQLGEHVPKRSKKKAKEKKDEREGR